MDEPFIKYPNKATALRVAHSIAKIPSFDCTRLWVEDAERNGIAQFILPKWRD